MRIAMIGLAAMMLVGGFVQAQQPEGRLDEAFALVEAAVQRGDVPGAVGLVAQRGKIIREAAFGLSDVENKTPITPQTLCWIASITKPVTVAAAMKLVEAGKLGLDDRVEKYLPEFAEQTDRDARRQVVKIRHLMSHTSGIQPNPPSRPSLFFAQEWLGRTIGEIPPLVAKTTLEFEPGSRVHYSNAAPYVLGRIVEKQSGQPFGAFMRQAILEPAGMRDTYFAIPAAEGERAAVVYRNARNPADGKMQRSTFFRFDPNWRVEMTMPDGGLFSSPREILKFLQLFLDDDGRVLSHDSVRAMRTVQAPGWGLGWAVEADGLFHHFGSSGTSAWADPQTEVVGILFFQVQNPGATDPLQAQFRDKVRAAFRDKADAK
jgi:CubicO group peptidase (beta-lactamase class C family)